MNLALQWGGTVVMLPRFDLEQFLRTIQDQKITRAFVAPPIVLALAKHPLVDQFDLSSLRIDHLRRRAAGRRAGPGRRRSGCARAPARRHRRAGLRHDRALARSRTPPPTRARARPATTVPKGSVGYAIPNTECRLVDPATGEDAAAGEGGEIWVRGPQVMKGYLGQPEATADTIDADGWLHTGDIAIVDDDGCYRSSTGSRS